MRLDPRPPGKPVDKARYTTAVVVRDTGVPSREQICVVTVVFARDESIRPGFDTFLTSVLFVSIGVVTFGDLILFIYIMKM